MKNDRFVKSPNLPQTPVTLCVCSDGDIAAKLEKHGIEVIKCVPSPFLDAELSAHPDMQLCHLGYGLIVADCFQANMIKKLREHGFDVIEAPSACGLYPDNIRFNGAVCGGFLFGRTDKLADEITDNAAKQNIMSVYVRQGYAKCSICTVSERAVITEDAGIAKAAERLGFDVLTIEKGDIFLSREHYGFIGGCSGKISADTVAFTGTLDSHRDGERIKIFLKKHRCRPLELSDNIMKDTGGILPIKEEKDVYTRN